MVDIKVTVSGERVRTVRADPAGAAGPAAAFRIAIDGVVEDVWIEPTDLGVSLVFADGRVVDAAVTEQPAGQWLVQLPHADVSVGIDARRNARGAASGSKSGEQRVVAPMPGRVVRVLVNPGDEVEARQGLVVIEAMKMENELSSPKAGRVKDVAVSEGMSIEAGRLLVVVE